ncbi:uncharacterized protein LOC115667152 isoform X8 [Syzygium oleosum]|uniref:uncharacterized protein LOC115667152 isoform X8 n=1 Tax=Syzygium oleosum TaxID=219896 RepID=UPI0024BA26F7|nr:uncharacterized protein LOC115667152 isoform X8 [Syzygium oleosum]
MVQGYVNHDERILVKVVEVFDVRVTDLENVICQLKVTNINFRPITALTFLEQYIFKLIEFQSYMTAVTLLEHFSIRQSGKSFLLVMMEKKEFRAAEKWATFMGKPMLCVLVQEYVDRKMLKYAYVTIKKNNLRQEFADVYHQCKESHCIENSKTNLFFCSSMKQLAEKGCWDVAESKAKGDKQFIEYLVYLAMEAGYSEKIDELCDRYSLQGFPKAKEFDATLLHRKHYLCLKELGIEDVFWVDQVDSLHTATCYIEESKVVGMDCEWKPNYVKGSKPNKVIASVIRSNSPAPMKHWGVLTILKCCWTFRMYLKNPVVVSRGLLRRNSDWEQRPLSQNQELNSIGESFTKMSSHLCRHCNVLPCTVSCLRRAYHSLCRSLAKRFLGKHSVLYLAMRRTKKRDKRNQT